MLRQSLVRTTSSGRPVFEAYMSSAPDSAMAVAQIAPPMVDGYVSNSQTQQSGVSQPALPLTITGSIQGGAALQLPAMMSVNAAGEARGLNAPAAMTIEGGQRIAIGGTIRTWTGEGNTSLSLSTRALDGKDSHYLLCWNATLPNIKREVCNAHLRVDGTYRGSQVEDRSTGAPRVWVNIN